MYFKKRIRKDLLPLSTPEKNQYARVYREFIKHITSPFSSVSDSFYLDKDVQFDINSWKKFIDNTQIKVIDKIFILGNLGKFSIEYMGNDKYLLFEPKIKKGGKRKSRTKISGRRTTKKNRKRTRKITRRSRKSKRR